MNRLKLAPRLAFVHRTTALATARGSVGSKWDVFQRRVCYVPLPYPTLLAPGLYTIPPSG